nr:copper-transporting ATPase RAN1 [Tanacetum cinerariifolium]
SLTATGFRAVEGKGAAATVSGQAVLIGNRRLLADESVSLSPDLIAQAEQLLSQAKTVLYIAVAGQAVGLVGVADTVRDTSAAAIKKLQALGIEVVMMTGDNAETAAQVAGQVGIMRYFAEVLPADKAGKPQRARAGNDEHGHEVDQRQRQPGAGRGQPAAEWEPDCPGHLPPASQSARAWLSPVSMASSSAELPSVIRPSVATFSPGRTTTRSPSCTCSMGTSTSAPSGRTTRAVLACRPMRLRMAAEVWVLARSSSTLPSRIRAMMVAVVS